MQGSAAIEKHIFRDADFIFTEKIHSFHDKYIDCFLLIGIDSPNTSLDEVKMTKNPEFSHLYYKRIMGGILSTSPLLSILSFSDDHLTASCAIYYLNNNEDIEDFFFVQDVLNWEGSGQTCFQIWRLNYASIHDMNDHWL